jgi:hypothetical protein
MPAEEAIQPWRPPQSGSCNTAAPGQAAPATWNGPTASSPPGGSVSPWRRCCSRDVAKSSKAITSAIAKRTKSSCLLAAGCQTSFRRPQPRSSPQTTLTSTALRVSFRSHRQQPMPFLLGWFHTPDVAHFLVTLRGWSMNAKQKATPCMNIKKTKTPGCFF